MTKLLLVLALVSLPAFAAKEKKPDTFKVDTKASLAKWEGRKLGGAHQGELKLKSGHLEVSGDKLIGGEVVIDMTTLKNYDQQGDLNTKLVNHLKSDDFFSVEKNPTSTLKITKVEGSNITGELTIKGITKPITFPAEIAIAGKKMTAKGTMKVDRTMFDIKFRSLKFFSDIGDKVIKDEFDVTFDIAANK